MFATTPSGHTKLNRSIFATRKSLLAPHVSFTRLEILSFLAFFTLFLVQFLFAVVFPCSAATTGVVVSGHTAFNPGASAATVQDNLENAIAASQVRGPSAVSVVNVHGKSVITYGGFYVCEVTPQMAAAAKTTPQLLAQKWAGGLKAALAASPKSPSLNSAAGNAKKPALASGKGYPKKTAPGNKPIANGGLQPYPQPHAPGLVQQAKIVYIPAGMTIPIVLSRPLSSMNARNGDPIEAVVAQDINLGNAVIPRNAGVLGVVTEAEAGGRMAHAGRLGLKFNRLVMPDGSQAPIQAHIVGGIEKYDEVGPPDSDVYKGERSSGSIKNAAIAGGIGAGAGAVSGTVIGAIAGGRYGVGRGAIAGLALGSGLGVAESVLLRRFKDVNVNSGQQLRLQMDSAARLAVPPMPSY